MQVQCWGGVQHGAVLSVGAAVTSTRRGPDYPTISRGQRGEVKGSVAAARRVIGRRAQRMAVPRGSQVCRAAAVEGETGAYWERARARMLRGPKVRRLGGTGREARRIACETVIRRPHDMAAGLAGCARAGAAHSGQRHGGSTYRGERSSKRALLAGLGVRALCCAVSFCSAARFYSRVSDALPACMLHDALIAIRELSLPLVRLGTST